MKPEFRTNLRLLSGVLGKRPVSFSTSTTEQRRSFWPANALINRNPLILVQASRPQSVIWQHSSKSTSAIKDGSSGIVRNQTDSLEEKLIPLRPNVSSGLSPKRTFKLV